MYIKRTFLTFVSVPALALMMTQTPWVGTAAAAEQQSAEQQTSEQSTQPPQTAPGSSSATAEGAPARAKTQEQRAEMDAEREKRYAELRSNAAQIGLELPEMPPWKSAQSSMHGMSQSHRRFSPEEHAAMREERRQAMAERFQAYRDTVDQMTEEQREAARAVFGRAPAMPRPYMPRMQYNYQGWGHPYQGNGHGMPYPPMMPYYNDSPDYNHDPSASEDANSDQ